MRLFNDSKSYATQANALRTLDAALAIFQKTRNDVRWLISVNDQGRFTPVVQFSSLANEVSPSVLALAGVSVVG